MTAHEETPPPWISGEFDISALFRGAPKIQHRAQFLDDVDRQLQVARKSIDSRFAVLVFRLDDYSEIVTEKGRTAADLVVRTIIEPVGPMLARHDAIALLENGTIGILLETARLRTNAHDFAVEVVGQLKTMAAEAGVRIPTVSAGIAKVSGSYVAAEDILRDAMVALRAGESMGRDQITTFHRGMDELLHQAPIAI
ncbi:MAG TPA: diguanylate cyclase [Gemmatimonadaceae bacterium]